MGEERGFFVVIMHPSPRNKNTMNEKGKTDEAASSRAPIKTGKHADEGGGGAGGGCACVYVRMRLCLGVSK